VFSKSPIGTLGRSFITVLEMLPLRSNKYPFLSFQGDLDITDLIIGDIVQRGFGISFNRVFAMLPMNIYLE